MNYCCETAIDSAIANTKPVAKWPLTDAKVTVLSLSQVKHLFYCCLWKIVIMYFLQILNLLYLSNSPSLSVACLYFFLVLKIELLSQCGC